MKIKLLIVLSFLNFNSYSNTCQEMYEDVKVFCQQLSSNCDDVKHCLQRRDTCVDSIPTDKEKCEQVNTCTQGIASQFPDSHRCEYYWHESKPNKGSCFVKKHFLYFEQSCPGRITGILKSIAYGINSAVDSKFNCAGTNKEYLKKNKSCQNAIKEYLSSCPKMGDTHELVKNFKDYKCSHSLEFKATSDGSYALDQATDKRQIQNSRSFGKEINQGNNKSEGPTRNQSK